MQFQSPIRAEQGEYVFTNITDTIGTYNVHQCVVIYIRSEKQKKHGLAHVDGHTEIDSVKNFLCHFGLDNYQYTPSNLSQFNITLMGAWKGAIMSGLNDAKRNLGIVICFYFLKRIYKQLKSS